MYALLEHELVNVDYILQQLIGELENKGIGHILAKHWELIMVKDMLRLSTLCYRWSKDKESHCANWITENL